MAEVDRLGWAVTVPLRAGGYVLGVRTNTPEAAGLLRELFADRLVPDAEPPKNLSVLLAPRAVDGVRELHRIYVTYTRTLRSRSALRVLDALWHELDLRDAEVARQRMLVDAAVVVRDGAAHLLPSRMRRAIVDDQRRWRDEGFAVVDRRRVELDPTAGTVIIPASGLTADRDELEARFAALDVDHRADDPQPSGTLPIASWVLPPGERSLAMRVIDAAGQVVDRPAHDGVAMLRGLADVLADLPDLTGAIPDEVRSRLAAR